MRLHDHACLPHCRGALLMAGYSGKPLVDKLGIRPGMRVYVDRGPAHTAALLAGATYTERLPRQADLILTFQTDATRLAQRLPTLIDRTVADGMVWVCWPKKASGMATDLDENVVREVGLAAGVVDVKVVAVDGTWSGLKFVRRLADR
jgi:hypothetical protein